MYRLDIREISSYILIIVTYEIYIYTLPETNSSHLKTDGWKKILSFWVPAYFQGQTVSFREGICSTGVEITSHERGFLWKDSNGVQ